MVKKQIERLYEPSLSCVDRVYEELMRIVQQCGIDVQQEMQRFPRLYERIHEIVSTLLSGRLGSTKQFVKDLVRSEMAYINTKHPEFVELNLMRNLEQTYIGQSRENNVIKDGKLMVSNPVSTII